jgi:hypothetical protein
MRANDMQIQIYLIIFTLQQLKQHTLASLNLLKGILRKG